jgi:hypothetical protein
MKKDSTEKASPKKTVSAKDIADSYNKYKIFQGKQYTGMTIGRSHKWYYDKGIWIDKKITPDKWLISFDVTKRRAGKAPEGSGVPVGTEYHWYILAHQMVKKLDANSYSTSMNGLKFKLAHKRSDKEKWNISDNTQRNHLIKILENFIKELRQESVDEFIQQEKSSVKTKKEKDTTSKKVSIKPILKRKPAKRKKEKELT